MLSVFRRPAPYLVAPAVAVGLVWSPVSAQDQPDDLTEAGPAIEVESDDLPPVWSAGLAAAIAEPGPPAAPVGLVGVDVGGMVFLGWAPNTDEDLADYVIQRLDADGEPAMVTVSLLNGHLDLSAPNGINRYRVAARDQSGNLSTSSVEVRVTVGSTPVVEPEEAPADQPALLTDDAEDTGSAETDDPGSDDGGDTVSPDADELDPDRDAVDAAVEVGGSNAAAAGLG